MNRRDLFKALMAMLPASWCAKAGVVESASSNPTDLPCAQCFAPCDPIIVEVIAGEDTQKGDTVTIYNGLSGRYLCELSHLAPIDVPCGIARHKASKGDKLLVQKDGFLTFGVHPKWEIVCFERVRTMRDASEDL